FEALIDSDNAHVSTIGLPFEVADVMNIIPLDGHPVVIEGNEPFKILPDLVIGDLLAVKGRHAHLSIRCKQLFSTVHYPRCLRERRVLISNNADVFAQVAYLLQRQGVDSLFSFGADVRTLSSSICKRGEDEQKRKNILMVNHD